MSVQPITSSATILPEGNGAAGTIARAGAPRKARARKATAPVVTSFTTESLALACGARSAKDFRRWLRATLRASGNGAALAGKGGRYAFTSEQGAAIVKAYGERKAVAVSGAAGDAFLAMAKEERNGAHRGPRRKA